VGKSPLTPAHRTTGTRGLQDRGAAPTLRGMHYTTMLVVGLLGAAVSVSAFAAEEGSSSAAASGKGTLYHVVSVKFKPDAKPEQIKAAEEAFAGLKEKIPTITSLHWGTNVSPEKRNKGFTHCFVLTFTSEKDRDGYLVDPAHKALGKVLGPVMEEVMVVDFWAK